MERPSLEIAGSRSAHAKLRILSSEVDDATARRASLLPGWSVGHVLTHLARNAEAMCRRIEAAKTGALVDQYQGGPVGRESEIDAGSGRPARSLVEDVSSWSDTLDDLFETMPADCWERPVRTVAGNEHPVALLPFRRWREVEVHLVDLGLSFTVDDWSSELVEAMLPPLLKQLPGRAHQRTLAAWLLGRGAPPHLERWA